MLNNYYYYCTTFIIHVCYYSVIVIRVVMGAMANVIIRIVIAVYNIIRCLKAEQKLILNKIKMGKTTIPGQSLHKIQNYFGASLHFHANLLHDLSFHSDHLFFNQHGIHIVHLSWRRCKLLKCLH